METIEQLTESILNAARERNHDEAQIIISDLLRKHMTPYITGLVDAKQIIRQWHGMNIPVQEEEIAWRIYEKNAPEMKTVNEALNGIK